jgi:UDP-galactopyranose mutase
MSSVLVIGSGFAGCTAALLLEAKGHQVTVVDRAPFLGGGCKTHRYGGHPYTFGPRHFLTKDETLFSFLDHYTPLRRIPEHEFLTYVEPDQSFYHHPLHRDDIARMPEHEQIERELAARDSAAEPTSLESYWLQSIGPTLYSKIVKTYTRKMWELQSNEDLDAGSTWPAGTAHLRTGPKAAWTESISAFPYAANGYDDYFDRAVDGCDVRLGVTIESFDMERRRVRIADSWHGYDLVVSTISPEILLNGAFGSLRWMGRELWKIVLPVPEVFPANVYSLYYANAEPFTRIVEYKKFYRNESSSTLIALEIPSIKNKLIPYPAKRDRDIADAYLAALPAGVFSIGRAGRYDYSVGIDASIEQARELAAGL